MPCYAMRAATAPCNPAVHFYRSTVLSLHPFIPCLLPCPALSRAVPCCVFLHPFIFLFASVSLVWPVTRSVSQLVGRSADLSSSRSIGRPASFCSEGQVRRRRPL